MNLTDDRDPAFGTIGLVDSTCAPGAVAFLLALLIAAGAYAAGGLESMLAYAAVFLALLPATGWLLLVLACLFGATCLAAAPARRPL